MYKFDAVHALISSAVVAGVPIEVSVDCPSPSWWRCERMSPEAFGPTGGEQFGRWGVRVTPPPSPSDAKSWIIESLRDTPGGFQSVRLRAPSAAAAAERAQLLLDALELTLDGT